MPDPELPASLLQATTYGDFSFQTRVGNLARKAAVNIVPSLDAQSPNYAAQVEFVHDVLLGRGRMVDAQIARIVVAHSGLGLDCTDEELGDALMVLFATLSGTL